MDVALEVQLRDGLPCRPFCVNRLTARAATAVRPYSSPVANTSQRQVEFRN